MDNIKEQIISGKCSLGIELGSTVIKSVLITSDFTVVEQGGYSWENSYSDGLYFYPLEQAVEGVSNSFEDLNAKVFAKYGIYIEKLAHIGVSAMMHGIVALDKEGKQLTKFLTWRNTNTSEAAGILSKEFNFNIPLRWTVAQLYQAHLEKKDYLKDLDLATSLAGYIHFILTGKKVLGIDDASGVFPIDSATKDYKEDYIKKFDKLIDGAYPWSVKDILPKVLLAGECAGSLTEDGRNILDKRHKLEVGTIMCPPEGDAGTGMIATNSIATKSGNISLGTSSFLMAVLEKPLSKVYKDIDIVSTPCGDDVAMIHCNNGSTELNDWMGVFAELTELVGSPLKLGDLFPLLFIESTKEEYKDNVVSYNLLAKEPVLDASKPLPLVAKTNGKLSLRTIMKSQLYSILAPIALGMKTLDSENVKLDALAAHGGLLKTKGVVSHYLSAALDTRVIVRPEASFGGAYGMALLASYVEYKNSMSLADFLSSKVFKSQPSEDVFATKEEKEDYQKFLANYKDHLYLEK